MKTLPALAALLLLLAIASRIQAADPQKAALDQVTQEIQTSLEAQKTTLNGEPTSAQLEQMKQDMETFRASLDAARPKWTTPAGSETSTMPQDPRKTALDQVTQQIQASIDAQKANLSGGATPAQLEQMRQDVETFRANLDASRPKWTTPAAEAPAMPHDPRKTSLDQAIQEIQSSIETQKANLSGATTPAQLEQMKQDVETFRAKLNAERAKF